MLLDRLVGAFTFRKGVYQEVEHDVDFTTTAWVLVVVVAILNQFGGFPEDPTLNGVLSISVSVVFDVIGFAIATFAISWVGKNMFNADVNFDEVVRAMGLAYVWRAIAVLGIVSFLPALACAVAPFTFAAWILGLIAWFVAAKEALDLDWTQTIVTVVVGWGVLLIAQAIAGVVRGILGFGAATFRELFGI